MADLHNGIKYAGPELDAFATAAGVSKDQAGVERLGETWTPVIERMLRPELAYLAQDFYAGMNATQAAVAAQASGVALLNPAGSNILATVEAVTYMATGSSGILVVGTEAAFRAVLTGTEARGVYRDGRQRGDKPRLSVLIGSNAIPVGSELERVTPNAATIGFVNVPIILQPGRGVAVFGQTVNISIVVAYAWREHMGKPGELNA